MTRDQHPLIVRSSIGPLPPALPDEREALLAWLGALRGAVLRNLDGLSDEQARWHPEGALLPVLGIVNHLTNVEWRWVDGGFFGAEIHRHDREFRPGHELSVRAATTAYRRRAEATELAVRSLPLDTPCELQEATDLRWVLLHLINETARHAGHADATRELLDGTTGE